MHRHKRSSVKYFSGFSLSTEASLFAPYIDESDFSVAGFSYGAQQAFEYVYSHPQERVERLVLLSPAFFQTQKRSFIRTQLRYFDQDREAYIEQFLANVSYPSTLDLRSYLSVAKKEELERLLDYKWEREKIETVLARGTSIEVYFGAKDKIIPSDEAFAFFALLTTSYMIEDTGHILAPSQP